jgi:TfoX/Sxy family transcriptional regulator of competence genes
MAGLTPLADRVRAVLASEPSTREVTMFGGLSFMVNERMVVAARRDGDLLVRVDPERDGELVALPGARRAEMGAGRSMGPGWISVAGASLVTDDALTFWTDVALAYNAGASGPGRAPGARR